MKNKENRKHKILTPLLSLILASSGLIVGTYALWNMLTKEQPVWVIIGEGVELGVTASAPEGKTLVPVGCSVNDDTQIEKVTLTYNVDFNNEVTKTFSPVVLESDKKIGDEIAHADLVNIVITAPETIDNNGADVTVEVTLTEPADEITYEAIKNKAITFKLTFTANL